MINTDHFIKRLEIIFDYYGLTASLFADKINVQRSSISHLLSGRNKPSLDFILKVLESFPEVELMWLLNGKGSFPKGENSANDNGAISYDEIVVQENNLFSQENIVDTSITELNTTTPKNQSQDKSVHPDSKIERIVVFYTDGTFKNYTP